MAVRPPKTMVYDPEIHHRRSVRLHGYDYSQPGEYFLTICTYEMRMIFGRVVEGRMELNDFGRIADDEWRRSAIIRKELELDEFTVMPNHVHGIVRIVDLNGQGARPCAPTPSREGTGPIPARCPRSVASFVAGVKPAIKTRINQLRNSPGAPVWERNYHEHIVRDGHELEILRDYIRHNALRWSCDRYNPDRGVLTLNEEGLLEGRK